MLNNQRFTAHPNLLKTVSNKIEVIARTVGLVERTSASFKPDVFLLALMKSAVAGTTSFNDIVTQMEAIDPSCSITAQALWDRLQKDEVVLERFIGECSALLYSKPIMDVKKQFESFERILTEDSSFVKMLKSCSDKFPAHGNAYGATAGIKLDLVFDLLTGTTLSLTTHHATTQDKEIGKDILHFLQPNDLIIRDMGYFEVGVFQQIEDQSADWLSRLPQNVNVTNEEGRESLESLLSKHKGNLFDQEVIVTDKGKRCRLVAVKKTKGQARKATKQLRDQAKKKGRQPSKKGLIRAKWHLLITSVPKEVLDAETLGKLYAQRWQIEIVFKAWKQSSNQAKALHRRSNYQHLLGIFLTEVFRMLITMNFYVKLRLTNNQSLKRLSIYKLSQWVATQLQAQKSLQKLSIQTPRLQHVLTQTRKRKSQINNMLQLLA